MNYYNEFDPKAAAWLRDLIYHGYIPPGFVDTRSILDVNPNELTKFRQCHFFAGIGGWSLALHYSGWPESQAVWTGSCPCQPFSNAGKQLGIKDERHLWPQFARLISECRPPVVFGEQVASKAGREWLSGVRTDLEEMAYAVGAADLCAAGVGAPHIRQRLFWVAHAALSGRSRDHREQRATNYEGHAGRMDDPASSRLASERCREPGEPERRGSVSGVGCETDGVADSVGHGFEGCREPSGKSPRREAEDRRGQRPSDHCEPCGLEHTPGDGWVERGPESGRRGASGGRESCGVANPHQGECGRVADGEGGKFDRQTTGWEQGYSQPEPSRVDGRVAHPDGRNPRPEWAERGGEHRQLAKDSRAGFWSPYELIPCRDGKVRRIEPGTFPLAHGVSGRVGLLRGYGNAIVPEVAANFILAYKESLTEIMVEP